MEFETIRKRLISFALTLLLISGHIYLKDYYIPQYSPYENVKYVAIVEKSDKLIEFINSKLEAPTVDNFFVIRKEIREIIKEYYALKDRQTIITKLVKNEDTLTKSQTELLQEKYNNIFIFEERYVTRILENTFKLKDFNIILRESRLNNEYKSETLDIKFKNKEFDVDLKEGQLIIYENVSDGLSLENIIARTHFLIKTGEQDYYYRRPSEGTMSITNRLITIRTNEISLKISGDIVYIDDYVTPYK